MLLSAIQGHAAAGTKPQHASHPDAHLAHFTTAHLHHALAVANDPELKAHLSNALAALTKYQATLAKEHQGMMQGKMSPRMMAAK